MLRSPPAAGSAPFHDVMRVTGGSTSGCSGEADNGVRDGLYRGHSRDPHRRRLRAERDQRRWPRELPAGVVPARAPRLAAPRRCEAQAVAARSYALAWNVDGKGFDQYADTRSQVYRGFLAETPSTSAAVAATAGEVVTYGGEIAVTYFFSTSGGHTENVENVFTGGDPKPWLKGVEDPHDDSSPYHRWGPFSYSRADWRQARGLGAGQAAALQGG